MKSFWFYFYNILILLPLKMSFYVLSLFNKKIRMGITNRKQLFENLIINISCLNRNKTTFWFHSSSMGEFEQAKPIIEHFKKNSEINIVVTFFSPSGYNNSLKYPYADVISYLPFDNVANAKRFINLIKPSVAIFMRYDFWPNFIWILSKEKIPTYIVDATMDINSKRKMPIAKQFHASLFKHFTKILTISEKDKKSFSDFYLAPDKLAVVGDTRFDRVYQKSLKAKKKNLFREEILKGKKVLVIGSSWSADEEVLIPVIKKLIKYIDNLLIVIAPHEPTSTKLEELEYVLKDQSKIRFSYKNDYNNENIIIIDSIGILLTLYCYADCAYVGGSFRQGIHNVLEPAVYGIPVIFGPKNKNSQEAQRMMELGCGIEISNKTEAYKVFKKLLTNEERRRKLGSISYNYIQKNIGATKKIIKEFDRK
ncbi:MAG: 3-deoxy-D-manno-octulosonic acid transferase [Ignavibacteriae bacterium]|nr:MAG: 3-deoxy-D-manno-octulosonic acid transferase [Ignavibacteriota bacterium]